MDKIDIRTLLQAIDKKKAWSPTEIRALITDLLTRTTDENGNRVELPKFSFRG